MGGFYQYAFAVVTSKYGGDAAFLLNRRNDWSFQGGYFIGLETMMQYDPTPNNPAFGYQGRVEPNNIIAWTIDYPDINAFDIIMRIPDQKIYRVESKQTTELQTVPVRQILQLTELALEMRESIAIQVLVPSNLSSPVISGRF